MAELKRERRRCYYEVLGVEKDCSFEEIRQAYKKLALKYHPDKLVQSGLSKEEATIKFQELSEAYDVLLDSCKRARYDSASPNTNNFGSSNYSNHSNQSNPFFFNAGYFVPELSPYFSPLAFSGYSSDSKKSFFRVYSEVFNNVHAAEAKYATSKVAPPELGELDSPYEQVTAFYEHWTSFTTSIDFRWLDIKCYFNESVDVSILRQKMNAMSRKAAQNRYNETVRNLAKLVKSKDKRVIDMREKQNQRLSKQVP